MSQATLAYKELGSENCNISTYLRGKVTEAA